MSTLLQSLAEALLKAFEAASNSLPVNLTGVADLATSLAFAKESGGNLAAIKAKTDLLAGAVNTSSLALEASQQAMAWLDIRAAAVADVVAFDATARSRELAVGNYALVATKACHVVAGNSSVNAVVADHVRLPADTPMGVKVVSGSQYIAAIKATDAGSLYILGPLPQAS